MTNIKWKHNWEYLDSEGESGLSYTLSVYKCSICHKIQQYEYAWYEQDPIPEYFDENEKEINGLGLYEEPECEEYPRGGLFSNLKKE